MPPRAIDTDQFGNMELVEGIRLEPEPIELGTDDLQVGDVLVWYARKKSRISAGIREFTGGPYSHVGIYIGEGRSVDSGPPGLEICDLDVLLSSFEYGRVMRYRDLGTLRKGRVASAAISAARCKKSYAWGDAIRLPLRRAAVISRSLSIWRKPMFAFPGKLAIRWREPSASETFCSRMVIEAYHAAGIFSDQELQECTWTPNDFAVNGGGFEYVGWLNHLPPSPPQWHPMDPFSPVPIGRGRAKWKRRLLRILSGSSSHK